MEPKKPSMDLILCTGNEGKVKELRALMPTWVNVRSLHDIGVDPELPETGSTLQANALQKARYVFERHGSICLADDTGLEVTALDGAPGVYSARYAGESKDPVANMAKLLKELGAHADRSARFRTVLALVSGKGVELFEGTVEGSILEVPVGTGGFGYDPLFRPEGSDLSFAQMDATLKNAISHRGRAMQAFLRYLGTIAPR